MTFPSEPIYYFDHCGTTRPSEPVKQSMIDSVHKEHFGNPSAVHHAAGFQASEDVERARLSIAEALRSHSPGPQHIIFTSGASEANNLVILGFWMRFRDRGARILYGATEHKSVLEPAKQVGDLPNGLATELPVDKMGTVDLRVLESLLKDNPGKTPTLVALMHTNNEIPTRHPVEAIAALCKTYKAYFHCDTVQGFVRETIDLASGNYGSVVLSPHKIYGPKGVGILAFSASPLRPPIMPPYVGGDQEFGVRPGTLNPYSIVPAALAVAEHEKNRAALLQHLRACDELFAREMTARCKGFRLTVPVNPSVPGIVNFYIDQQDAPSLLQKMQRVCINRGASCTGAGGEKYSHVPKALGLPIEIQANVLRASFGWNATLEDIKKGVEEIALAVKS